MMTDRFDLVLPDPGSHGEGAPADLPGQLRAALIRLGREMAAAGATPDRLAAMTWHLADPTLLIGQRVAVDLVYRDVFGGMRPPVEVLPAPADALGGALVAVSARLSPPRPKAAGLVYRGFDAPTLGREYSARAAVPDHLDIFARWRREGQAFTAARCSRPDQPYGPRERETYDLYLPAGVVQPPLAVFIHGGYWQAMDKADHAQLVAGLIDAGAAVAVVNYDLCPDLPLEGLVEQVRRCCRHLVRAAGHHGYRAQGMLLVGHSAGAHLAAMLLATDWGGEGLESDPLGGAVLVSGLFDLEPIGLLPMGPMLGLDGPAAARLSPNRLARRSGGPVVVAVGEGESGEFKRQSRLLAEAWNCGPCREIAGTHHFSVIETLVDGALRDLAVPLLG